MMVQTVANDTGLSIREADTAIKNGDVQFDREIKMYYIVQVS